MNDLGVPRLRRLRRSRGTPKDTSRAWVDRLERAREFVRVRRSVRPVDLERDFGDENYVVARSRSLPLNFGFRRGDSNRNSAGTLSDVANILNFWGTGTSTIGQLECPSDVNDSGTFTPADAVFLINHVAFAGGPVPKHQRCDQLKYDP